MKHKRKRKRSVFLHPSYKIKIAKFPLNDPEVLANAERVAQRERAWTTPGYEKIVAEVFADANK
jgi:hypothetical protein